MKKLIDWRIFVPAMAILAAISFAASRIFDLPFLPTFLVAIGTILVNGLVATIEDDLPSGFNNPDGASTPVYATTTVRLARWVLAFALGSIATASLVVGLSSGDRSDISFIAGVSIACLLLAVALLAKYRWAPWAALLALLGGIAGSVFLR